MRCDRALPLQEGLPRRRWYRHEIYAPGFYAGYTPKTRARRARGDWRTALGRCPDSDTAGGAGDLL